MKQSDQADEVSVYKEFLVHSVRLGLEGRRSDVYTLVTRLTKALKERDPEFSRQIAALVKSAGPGPALRSVASPTPVDLDSRSSLLKVVDPTEPEIELILESEVQKSLKRISDERKAIAALLAAGLAPASTILFTGPPGVGKSLAARWLSFELNLPLAVLDLSSVMSSYLGKTGQNIRNAFSYAQENPCILFLDEIDAVAKRRDDDTDIGELKRLVTVLLQEFDKWPSHSLLLAATNHHHLLDTAIWRRFDETISFPLPDHSLLCSAVSQSFSDKLPVSFCKALAMTIEGKSFGECEKMCNRLQREAVLANSKLEEVVIGFCRQKMDTFHHKKRQDFALSLVECGMSQRQASEVSGVSRDTIRTIGRKIEK